MIIHFLIILMLNILYYNFIYYDIINIYIKYYIYRVCQNNTFKIKICMFQVFLHFFQTFEYH